MLTAGSKLGPYEVVAPLGAGGMGEVYRARDPRLQRDVALKVLPLAIAADAERRARFEKEARAASALAHPNIVVVYDVGESDGSVYIAMELVEGKTVRELLAAGALPSRRALEVGTQIAEGLAAAHAAGIVHRDLKPENLIVSKDGYVKILDFRSGGARSAICCRRRRQRGGRSSSTLTCSPRSSWSAAESPCCGEALSPPKGRSRS